MLWPTEVTMYGRVYVPKGVTTPPPPPVQYYRVPHDKERRDVNARNEVYGMAFMGPGYWSGPVRANAVDGNKTIPEPYRMLPDQTTPLYDWAIRMWRNINLQMDDEQFCLLLDNRWMLTNGTGWPGRRNIILGRDLDKGFPTFHAPLIAGGAYLKCNQIGDFLEIENIRYNQPVTAQYVLERPWLWYWATEVAPNGNVTYITRKGTDGSRVKIRVPFITKEPVMAYVTWLHKLPLGFVPPEATWRP